MFYPYSKGMAIFAAVLMLSLGGMVAVAHAAEAPDPAKKAETSGDKATADKDSLKSHYVKVPALILPVIGDNGVEQIVSLVVMIEATSKDNADEITQDVPRLNDAYVTELYGTLDRREHMKNGVVDIVYLKQRLMKLTGKIAGQDKVKDLLIQGISQHQS